MFDFNLRTERNDALRFRYSKEEIRAAVSKNLEAVMTFKAATEERLQKALVLAGCNAPREKLVALAERAEFDFAFDARASEILDAVRLLQPLEEVQGLLELMHKRMDFAPHTVLPGGTDVLLTGSDYQSLIRPFNPERVLRNILGYRGALGFRGALRPHPRRMGLNTALREDPRDSAPASINDLLKWEDSEGLA